MTPEENCFRTIEFRYPEWIVTSVSLMPATWRKYREALEDILDPDRQLFPFCTPPQDIHDHVREAVTKLSSKEGGLMLHAECDPDVPLENIEAICQALEKYRPPSPMRCNSLDVGA